jgi:dienelactone hydrolase
MGTLRTVFRGIVVLPMLIAMPSLATAEERVTFPSLDATLAGGKATTITARLYRPQGDGPFPAVVGLHGCSGLVYPRGRWRDTVLANFADWAERLSAAGYVVLLPDSYGPRGFQELCSIKDRTDMSRARIYDAYGALVWLQKQPFVAPNRVALMGWSHGGGTVMRSIAAKSEARPASLPHGDFRAAVAFYPGCPDPKRSSGRDWRSIAPLLVLIGEAEDWTPVQPCRTLAAAAAKRGDDITVRLYPGAYHAFDSPTAGVRLRTGLATAPGGQAHSGQNPAARADAIKRVPAFLHQHLGG